MERLNCLRCQYMHEDNGNCTAAGGFCTAVPAAHCRLLQEYLDTGLTPEEVPTAVEMAQIYSIIEENKRYRALNVTVDRLKELARADKEGRVVVLPSKVGRRVYVPDFEAQTVANVRIQGISITITGRVVLHFGGYPAESVWGDRCGIDWFLTYEGAEATLRRANG